MLVFMHQIEGLECFLIGCLDHPNFAKFRHSIPKMSKNVQIEKGKVCLEEEKSNSDVVPEDPVVAGPTTRPPPLKNFRPRWERYLMYKR